MENTSEDGSAACGQNPQHHQEGAEEGLPCAVRRGKPAQSCALGPFLPEGGRRPGHVWFVCRTAQQLFSGPAVPT